MQPGTYQVEFYAQSVIGCGGFVNVLENNGVLFSVSSTGIFECSGTPFVNPHAGGNMAWTQLLGIPSNLTVTVQFVLQANSPAVTFQGGVNLTFLKLK